MGGVLIAFLLAEQPLEYEVLEPPEKRGLDCFFVCPSTVHSWKTDTRRTGSLPVR
jgi:hypothetical protein